MEDFYPQAADLVWVIDHSVHADLVHSDTMRSKKTWQQELERAIVSREHGHDIIFRGCQGRHWVFAFETQQPLSPTLKGKQRRHWMSPLPATKWRSKSVFSQDKTHVLILGSVSSQRSRKARRNSK